MYNFRISMQNSKIVAFEGSKEIGSMTKAELEDFCSKNNITLPAMCDEQNKECISIVQEYFQNNANN